MQDPKTGNGGEGENARTPKYLITGGQKADLANLFSHHKPFGDQSERYEAIRAKAKELATVIMENTPKSADQNAALRHVREAVFTANAAIAVNEEQPKAESPL
jgi:hypothetical protein